MKDMGYTQSQGDHTLFIRHSKTGGVTALLVCVDDIIITGNDGQEQLRLKKHLAEEFEIKHLGKLKYFLGIEVAHSKQGIFISQQKYVFDLLQETGYIACQPVSTPIDLNQKIGAAEEDRPVDKGMYQCLVGRLIYLSHTRPDIAYALSVINQCTIPKKLTCRQSIEYCSISKEIREEVFCIEETQVFQWQHTQMLIMRGL